MVKHLRNFINWEEESKEITVAGGGGRFPWAEWRKALDAFLFGAWSGIHPRPRISFAGTVIAYDERARLYRAYGEAAERNPRMKKSTPISGKTHVATAPATPERVHDALARLLHNADMSHLVIFFEEYDGKNPVPYVSFTAPARYALRMGFDVCAENLPLDLSDPERV